MKELTDAKLEVMVNDYINGNLSDLREAIRKLNKLEITNLLERAKYYGVEEGLLKKQVVLALSNE